MDKSKDKLDGLLLPYQRAWIEDTSSFKVWEKSRRIGASWAEAADAVLHAFEGSGNYYYMSYNREMTKSFIQDCKMWTKSFQAVIKEENTLQDDPRTDNLIYEMRYSSGKIIQALSGAACNIRSKGRPGDVVGIDEAAFVADLAELLKAAKAVMVWGGKVRIWSTHNGQLNPFNQLIVDIRAGRNDYSLHRTTLDDAIGAGLYRRICEIKKESWSAQAEKQWREELIKSYGDGWQEELMVVPSADRGAWLPRALVEQCCNRDYQVVRWNPPQSSFALTPASSRQQEMTRWFELYIDPELKKIEGIARSCIGVDFARSGDLSVFAIAAVAQDMKINFPLIVELRDCPFDQQRQLLLAIIDTLPQFSGVALDAGGNGQFLAETAQQHVGTGLAEATNLSEQWYREHMPPLKAAFEDQAIAIAADEDIVEDLRSLELRRGVPRAPEARRLGSDGGQRHADAAIAIALALRASKRSRAWQADDITYFPRTSSCPAYTGGEVRDYTGWL